MAYGLQFENKIYTGNEPNFIVRNVKDKTLVQSDFPIELISSQILFNSDKTRFIYTGDYIQFNQEKSKTPYGIEVNSKNLLSEFRIVKRETVTFKNLAGMQTGYSNEFHRDILSQPKRNNYLVLYRFISIDSSKNFTVERVFLEKGGIVSNYGAINNSIYLTKNNISYKIEQKEFKQVAANFNPTSRHGIIIYSVPLNNNEFISENSIRLLFLTFVSNLKSSLFGTSIDVYLENRGLILLAQGGVGGEGGYAIIRPNIYTPLKVYSYTLH